MGKIEKKKRKLRESSCLETWSNIADGSIVTASPAHKSSRSVSAPKSRRPNSNKNSSPAQQLSSPIPKRRCATSSSTKSAAGRVEHLLKYVDKQGEWKEFHRDGEGHRETLSLSETHSSEISGPKSKNLALTKSNHEDMIIQPEWHFMDNQNLYKVVGEMSIVEMGEFEMLAWFPSEYPQRLAKLKRLYLCPYCLKCLGTPTLLRQHRAKCGWHHPPGIEIYRDGDISFWEVNGKNSKIYCRNLCLLAKLFLAHKTLYHDVVPFLFYILTKTNAQGAQIVGYFSKEKESFMNCNLSCVLTLPPYQGRGYGRLLIEFSYLLSQKDGKIGSPEHPLSEMGFMAYRRFWKDMIFDKLLSGTSNQHNISLEDMSIETGIHIKDIVSTLQGLGMLKCWENEFVIYKDPEVIRDWQSRYRNRSVNCLKASCLDWEPYHHRKSHNQTNSNGGGVNPANVSCSDL